MRPPVLLSLVERMARCGELILQYGNLHHAGASQPRSNRNKMVDRWYGSTVVWRHNGVVNTMYADIMPWPALFMAPMAWPTLLMARLWYDQHYSCQHCGMETRLYVDAIVWLTRVRQHSLCQHYLQPTQLHWAATVTADIDVCHNGRRPSRAPAPPQPCYVAQTPTPKTRHPRWAYSHGCSWHTPDRAAR